VTLGKHAEVFDGFGQKLSRWRSPLRTLKRFVNVGAVMALPTLTKPSNVRR